MAKITIIYAALLILLGIGAYIGSGMASWTALIPSIFGAIFLLFGVLALKESLRKHAMHAASIFALLAILGTARGFIGSFTLLTGGEVARPAAVIVQALTFLLSSGYLALCVKSFIDARRRRIATA
jgi:hypothetical protein